MCEVSMEFWDEWTCQGPVPVHASCSRLAPLNAVTWLAPAAAMSSGKAVNDSASAGGCCGVAVELVHGVRR